jgi:hypothetical protein
MEWAVHYDRPRVWITGQSARTEFITEGSGFQADSGVPRYVQNAAFLKLRQLVAFVDVQEDAEELRRLNCLADDMLERMEG